MTPTGARPEALLAVRSRDLVFSCAACGAAVVRTSNERFEARELRCPRRDCRKAMRLTETDPAVPGRSYFCKTCRVHLFDSPTPVGRVWITCPNPTCRHNVVPQALYLGGGPAPRIVGRVRITVGNRPRQR